MPKGLINVIEDLLNESHNGKVENSGDANLGDHRSSKIEANKGPHNQGADNANDVGKSGHGKHPSAASSKIDANKGPHSQAGDNAGDTNSIDGRKAKPSKASAKAEGDEGPHSQAGDSWDVKGAKLGEAKDSVKDLKHKFNKLIDAEKEEPEHDDDDLEKVKESNDIHIHIGDHGGSKKSSAPAPAAKAPAGGRGDSGGDESGGDEIPADKGDSAEKDRNPSLGEGTDKSDFAKLAPPKDKITFADKLAGIKKEGGKVNEKLIGNQDKLDVNKNGKVDGDDLKKLRSEASPVNPFDWKNTPRQTDIGSKTTRTGHEKSTNKYTGGTVYRKQLAKEEYDELCAMHEIVVAEMIEIIGEEYLDDYLQEDSQVQDFVAEDLMDHFAQLAELAEELAEAKKKMEDEDIHLHVGGDDKGGDDEGGEEPGEGGDEKPDAAGKIPPKEPTKDVDFGSTKTDDAGDEGGDEGESGGGEEDKAGKKPPFAEGKTYDKRSGDAQKYKERQQQQAAKRARRQMGEAADDGTDNDEHEVGKSPDQGPHDMATCNAGDTGKSPSKGAASSAVAADKGPHSQSGDNGNDTGSIDGKTAKPSKASAKVEADKGPHKQSGEGLKEDGDDLSEDFREKARIIFETAVNEKVAAIKAELEEQYQAALDQEIDEMQGVVAEAVGEAITEWQETNKLEIKYSLRTEIAENFIRGMRALVAENYIEIPAEDVSVVDELSEAVEDLKARAAQSQELIESLQSELLAMHRDAIISQVAEDLTETQKLKLTKLSENVEAISPEEFAQKLCVLKDTYFAEGFDNSALLSSLSEGVIGTEQSYEDEGNFESVNAYAQFLSKTSKK